MPQQTALYFEGKHVAMPWELTYRVHAQPTLTIRTEPDNGPAWTWSVRADVVIVNKQMAIYATKAD